MPRHVDVLVIGAGSAGLAAVRQIEKHTDNYLLVDPGPLGTTCARVGCMPSKALIKIAGNVHGARKLNAGGLAAHTGAPCDIPAVLRRVRQLRDRFASGMVEATRTLAGEHLLQGTARLLGPDRVLVDGEEIRCSALILAVGSRPTVPAAWREFEDRVLTSDNLFEQETLPPRIGVLGLGIIGLELGQALARLGIAVTGFGRNERLCRIQNDEINQAALEALGSEFPLHVGQPASVTPTPDGLLIRSGDTRVEVDAVIAATGVTPNLSGLGLETLGVPLDERGIPPYDPYTTRIADLPVFIAGDANGCLSLLHEAQDEGFIAGRNATAPQVRQFCRRTGLKIVFSDPQIAQVGRIPDPSAATDIVVGRCDFTRQARAIAEERNTGLLHLYAAKQDGRILGAEMVAPEAEHLAHQIAQAVHRKMTVRDMLAIPFYHPTVEEGLRTALRDAAARLYDSPDELSLCESCPETPLC